MKTYLQLEITHTNGTKEYVQVDVESDDAAERIDYCLEQNTEGFILVKSVTVNFF